MRRVILGLILVCFVFGRELGVDQKVYHVLDEIAVEEEMDLR